MSRPGISIDPTKAGAWLTLVKAIVAVVAGVVISIVAYTVKEQAREQRLERIDQDGSQALKAYRILTDARLKELEEYRAVEHERANAILSMLKDIKEDVRSWRR